MKTLLFTLALSSALPALAAKQLIVIQQSASGTQQCYNDFVDGAVSAGAQHGKDQPGLRWRRQLRIYLYQRLH